jgi:hypothetical protein
MKNAVRAERSETGQANPTPSDCVQHTPLERLPQATNPTPSDCVQHTPSERLPQANSLTPCARQKRIRPCAV